MILRLAAAAVLLASLASAQRVEFRAGAASLDITPDGAIWLSGYAARTHPSTGVLAPLSAKALAFEDSRKHRAVIVTTDLIGLPRSITDAVSARLAQQQGLERAQVLFNSSHTHTGPVVRGNLSAMYNLSAGDAERVNEYSRVLTEKLYQVVVGAIANLAPATVSLGSAEAPFAMNRRTKVDGVYRISDNPEGPVDHSVPVIRVLDASGKLKAVLFGYACHNTTLTAENYEISADYAGFAQQEIEAAHPGAIALFLQLCAGDQNPTPRGTPDHARQHGKELASAVDAALAGKLEPLKGELRSSLEVTELNFALHTRDQFEEDLKSRNPFVVTRARQMLKAYDEGHPIRRTPYPVQAIRFGNGPAILALGGEVVIDYDQRVKREFPNAQLIVAGYSNDVMCYIPSKRVLKEGGYEANESMIYYGMPGPFSDDVEDRVFDTIRKVLKRVGVK